MSEGGGMEPTTWASIAAGVAALPYILHKIWSTIRQDNKQDAKGDNVDARIQQFTSTLQAHLDKALARADQLQAAYNTLQGELGKMAAELARAQARAEALADQNAALLRELQSLRFAASPKIVATVVDENAGPQT